MRRCEDVIMRECDNVKKRKCAKRNKTSQTLLQSFARERFYTQKLLHTDPFIHTLDKTRIVAAIRRELNP